MKKFYHCVVWISAFIACMLPFFDSNKVYGDSGAWCWIRQDKQLWRVVVWYGPLFLFFVYVLTMYIWIVKTLYSQKHMEFYQREGEEEARAKWNTSMRLTKYPLIFIIKHRWDHPLGMCDHVLINNLQPFAHLFRKQKKLLLL